MYRQDLSGLIRTLNKARVRAKNPEVKALLDEALFLTVKDFKSPFTRKRPFGKQPREVTGRFLSKRAST